MNIACKSHVTGKGPGGDSDRHDLVLALWCHGGIRDPSQGIVINSNLEEFHGLRSIAPLNRLATGPLVAVAIVPILARE
jgi:hypothetical protein